MPQLKELDNNNSELDNKNVRDALLFVAGFALCSVCAVHAVGGAWDGTY
jgi:hypothetical protein